MPNKPMKIEITDLSPADELIYALDELHYSPGRYGLPIRSVKPYKKDEFFSLREHWNGYENVLNARLLVLLAGLPQGLLTLTVNALIGGNIGKEFQVKTLKKNVPGFVEPDALLQDGDHLVMVELKTAARETKPHPYTFAQLLNYSHLPVYCKTAGDDALPTRFSHMLLLPSVDLRWIKDARDWVDALSEGTPSRIRLKTALTCPEDKSGLHWDSALKVIREMPIYVRSWGDLPTAYRVAVEAYGDARNHEHWFRIAQELERLAQDASRFLKMGDSAA